MHEVTIAGEPRTIGEFSAYKAIKAMELVTEVEDEFRELIDKAAEFKREYEAAHVTEMDRAEARRYFAPRPLTREVPIKEDGEYLRDGDGVVVFTREPLLRGERPVLGPDPLAHLTEEDWAGSGHKLRIPDSPGRNTTIAAMVPKGFRIARTQVLRLLALALTSNDDLEKWDTSGDTDVDAQLDEEARRLVHRARADEIVEVAIATVEAVKEQLAGPFDRMISSIETVTKRETPASPPVEPMRMEQEEGSESSSDRPTSSTNSEADTDGTPEPSSTAPASASPSS